MNGVITTLIKKSESRQRGDGKQDKGGYGFIRDEDGRDRFFHAKDLRGTRFDQLKENLKVEFDPTIGGARGNGNNLRAENVKVIG